MAGRKVVRRKPKVEPATVKVRRVINKPARMIPKLRAIHVGEGLPSIPEMVNEIQDMRDVLMGRVPPPLDFGFLSMMECADGYFARCAEMTILLQEGEREGRILRGQAHYKFRTGELRTMMELCKRAADLGSRRLTQESLRFEMEQFGRESV